MPISSFWGNIRQEFLQFSPGLEVGESRDRDSQLPPRLSVSLQRDLFTPAEGGYGDRPSRALLGYLSTGLKSRPSSQEHPSILGGTFSQSERSLKCYPKNLRPSPTSLAAKSGLNRSNSRENCIVFLELNLLCSPFAGNGFLDASSGALASLAAGEGPVYCNPIFFLTLGGDLGRGCK